MDSKYKVPGNSYVETILKTISIKRYTEIDLNVYPSSLISHEHHVLLTVSQQNLSSSIRTVCTSVSPQDTESKGQR